MSSGSTGRPGLHVISLDPGSDPDALRAWYQSERIPALKAVPGVKDVSEWETAFRYVRAPVGGMMAVPGFPTYMVNCVLEDVDVALSDAFLDAKGRSFSETYIHNGKQGQFTTLMNLTMTDVMQQVNEGQESTTPGGMMVVSITPQRDILEDFHRWYDEVHLNELLSCPGMQRARRYRSLEGIPNFFAFYDLDEPDILKGEKFVYFSTRKFEELPAIQQKVGPNMTSNMCDVYRRIG